MTEKNTEGVANLFQFHPLTQSPLGREKLKHSTCVSSPVWPTEAVRWKPIMRRLE